MEKSFLPHILYYSYNYTILIFRIFLNFDSFLLTIPFFLSLKKRRRKGFSVVSSRVNVLRGNEKRGIEGGRGERKREQQLLKAEARERERERIRNSLWSASDWRFCIAEADVQPLAESTFSFSSRCEACRVASRATGLVPPLQETRWLVPSLDYPDYCSSKIGGGRGRKEGRRGEGTEVFVMNKDARGSLRFFCKR